MVDSTGLDRAGRKLKDIQRGARDADAAATRLKSAFAGLAGVLGAAFSVREITKAVDSYRQIENQLRLVTSSARELKAVQEGVLAVANATGASLDTTARLYANLERFAGDFLKTQQDTLDLTRAINQTAVISGASVTEAGNAVRQLSQAIAGGVLRAEEFNSIIENMPRLGEAVAAGLGVSIGGLRKQVNEGLVTSEKLISALQSQFDVINQEFLGSAKTIGQALQVVGNMITVELGQRLQGVQSIAIKALQTIGANIDSIIKAVEGLSIALGALAVSSLISFATSAAASIQAWFAATVSLSTAKLAAAKAEAQYNAAIASGTAIALNSAAAQKARAVLSLDNARADEVAALAKIADARAAQTQLATNLQLIGVQRAQAVSQLELARGIAIATGARTQQAVAEANLAKTMAAGIATRKALAAVEAEIAAAQNAHAAAAARVAAAETAYSAAAATSATNVGFLGRAFAQLRSVIIGIGAIIAANPLGVLVVGITAAVSAVVIFRDEIAKLLFGVKDAGAVIQATFEVLGPIFGQAASSVGGFVTATLSSIGSLVSGFNDLFKGVRDRVLNLLPSEAIDTVKQWAQTVLEIVIALAKAIPELITDAFLLPLRAIRSGLNAIGNVEFLPDNVREQIRGTAEALDKLANSVDNAAGAETVEQIAGGARAVLDGIKAAASATVGVYDDIKVRTHEIANAQGEVTKRVRETKEAVTGLSKEQQKAADALKNYKDELEGQRAIIEAARLGEHQERVAREVLSIRRQIKDISIEDARALAEQNVELEIQLDLIHEQRRIMEEPFRNLADNLTDAIINGGRAGVGGLKKIFGSFLNDLKRAFLYQVFNPLIQSLSASLGGLFGVGIFTPGINGGNPANAVSGSLLAAARTNGVSVGGPGLGQAALGFGGLAAGGASSIFGLASLIGPGNLGRLGAGIGNFLGLSGNVTGGLSKALAGAGTFGGALGGIGGSLLSGALFGKSKGQSIGSTIGGIGGSFFGPIGSAIGSFLGGAIGSLFGGTKKSAASISTFSGGLDIGSSFGKGSGRQEQALSLGGAVIDSLNSLASVIGGQIVAGLNLGSIGTRKSNFIFDPTGANRTKGAGVQSFASEEQAIRAAINAAIGKGVISGDSALIQLTKSLAGANVGLEQMASVLGLVKQITDSGKPAVSKYGEALKELDAALQAATASAHGSLQAEQALASARAQAVAALKGQFEKDVATAIEEIKDPAVASFRELAKGLASTLSDAKSLGVDVSASSQVMELIGLQVEQFFEQAASNGGDIVALTTKLSELGEILKDLGVDANIAAQALAKAKANQKSLFDQQVQNDIGNFLNGPLDQLEKLLEAQKTRLEQAEALGADLSQVERLSALELRQFFQGLSESALNEVRDFLGLFEEAADSVARNLDLSRQDLRAKADQFQQFAEQFSSLATDFRERFVAASPRESIDILRARATDLLGQVGQGNESAAQALPQVLNQLVESARQTFGNTKGFQDVLEFALGTLSEAEKSAIGVKTEAERQIAALDESNDLLSEIRDILQSTQAFNALLSSANAGGVASAGQLLDLIRGGAGLTPNPANDNAAALSVTALIGQSLTPIINPLVSSIDGFTQQVAQMPYLQRLQIDATDRVRMAVEDQTARLEDKLDRLEVLSKQQLAELEAA